MAYFPIGMIVFFGCIVASRYLGERAFRRLDDAQKLRLLNTFSGMRAFSMVPLLAIMGVMWGIPYLLPSVVGIERWCAIAGMVLMLLYLVAMHFWVKRRLNAVELPPANTREFLIARHVGSLGVVLLFAILLLAF